MSSNLNLFPSISVVLPTYNRAYILSQAIRSVLHQTYTDWELIIVDDGSTDDTHELVASFADPRIRYIKHEQNRGLAAGRNTGIKNARGAYIANLDSDDEWFPQKLECELTALKAAPHGTDVVYSEYERDFGDGTVAREPSTPGPREGNLRAAFLWGNLISMQMALVKKGLFQKTGLFDEAIPALQDWEFWIRASAITKFVFIAEVLTKGMVMQDSIAKNHRKRLAGREIIFNKHETVFRAVPGAYARLAFSIGHTHALQGNTSHARSYLKKAAAAQPLQLKYLAGLLLAKMSLILCKPKIYKYIATSTFKFKNLKSET